MNIRLFYSIIIGLSCLGLYAQTDLPSFCTVALPKALEPDLLRDKDIQDFLNSPNWGQDNKTNSYWKVYSDRANNVTYKSPNDKSERFATLNMNEELRIAKIENGFALVYVEQFTAAIYPKINKPVSKGWVPMNNLLLWRSCPADEKGIYHKALPLLNVDEWVKAKNNGTEKELGKVFDNPMAKSNPKKLKASMEFYFVMKEDKESGMVLLSKRNILTGKTSQLLYGWVNKASYVSWNNRVYLEPNWDPSVAEKLKGTKVGIYQGSERIADVTIGETNNLGQEKTKYRMFPDVMRYPFVGTNSKNNERYDIIAFTSFDSIDIAFEGSVEKKDSKTGLDYWKPVIFISNAEYNNLISKLQPVMAAANQGSKGRRAYVEAMRELMRTLYGDIDEKEMMDKNTLEVMALVAGLNVKSAVLCSGRTLLEIQDKKIVSQDEFANMISEFKKKYINLDRIKNGYKYSTKIEGDTWYWIPVEELP